MSILKILVPLEGVKNHLSVKVKEYRPTCLTENVMVLSNSKCSSWLTLRELFKHCGVKWAEGAISQLVYDDFAAELLHDQLETEAGGFYCGA